MSGRRPRALVRGQAAGLGFDGHTETSIMHHGDVPPELARRLEVLRERIDDAGIPSPRLDESLNVATSNIRDFGKSPRLVPIRPCSWS